MGPLRWINDRRASFATRLVAFAVVEGIFFSVSFAGIFWLKKRGLMPGLTFSNKLISRNEAMHCNFACLLFSYREHKPFEVTVLNVVREAVNIEREFVMEALKFSLIGMNERLMSQYVEFVADRLLAELDYPKYQCATNPFRIYPWKVKPKFEKRVGENHKTGVMASEGERRFTLQADF